MSIYQDQIILLSVPKYFKLLSNFQNTTGFVSYRLFSKLQSNKFLQKSTYKLSAPDGFAMK